jgi:hypothetical protein
MLQTMRATALPRHGDGIYYAIYREWRTLLSLATVDMAAELLAADETALSAFRPSQKEARRDPPGEDQRPSIT